LSFVSGLESKKHQTFSLGALWRISLILDVGMYKLCIDEEVKDKDKKEFIKYRCKKCNYSTEIPYNLINIATSINSIYTNQNNYPIFKCNNCDGYIIPEEKDKK
jgi:uncharacterized membrane protein